MPSIGLLVHPKSEAVRGHIMQTFNNRHASEILKPCDIDGLITIDERGVWPKVEHDATQQGEPELFR